MTEQQYTAALNHVARFASERFDVFISYSSADTAVAMTMSQLLGDNDISHWYAPNFLRDKGGVSYQHEIARGVNNCTVLLLLYSASASNSSWVEEEVALAREKHKVILLLCLDETPLYGIYDFLRHRQHFVLSFAHPADEIRKVLESIANAIYREVPVQLPPEQTLREMLRRMVEPIRPYSGLRERYYYDVRFRRRIRCWGQKLILFLLLLPAAWIVGTRLFVTHYVEKEKLDGSKYYGYQNLAGCNLGFGVDSNATRIYRGKWFMDYFHGKGYLDFYSQGETAQSYHGGFFLNKYYGYGVLTCRKFQHRGRFFWGLCDGYGERIEYPDSDSLGHQQGSFYIYKGFCKNGVRHGYGEWFQCSDTTVSGLASPLQYYKGRWKKGTKHGYGEYTDSVSTFYKRSKSTGYCQAVLYKGDWKDGLRNGKGTQTWSYFLPDSMKGNYQLELPERDKLPITSLSGCLSYIGAWKENQIHGKGKMIYVDGSSYEGEFADNKLSGKGTYQLSDGRILKGQWRVTASNLNKGTISYPNGDVYVGYWNSYGRLDSLGEIRTADGWIARGKWSYNRLDSGEVRTPDGEMRIYLLSKKYINRGTIRFPNGSRYEGSWRGFKRDGRGDLFNAEGRCVIRNGIWRDDELINQ